MLIVFRNLTLDHKGVFKVLGVSSKGAAKEERIRNSIFLYRKIRNFKINSIRFLTPIGMTLYRISCQVGLKHWLFLNILSLIPLFTHMV